MVLNGKYFVPPPQNLWDLKQVLRETLAVGAGRLVTKDGIAIGPWTPELLSEAISLFEDNHKGLDPRTVRFWLQNNETIPGPDNIYWLARVFGCNDPEAVNEWRVFLMKTQRRFFETRKAH